MASNFKAPLSLENGISYEAWLKEISIWHTFTDIDIKKLGPVVFLTLERKAHESVLSWTSRTLTVIQVFKTL